MDERNIRMIRKNAAKKSFIVMPSDKTKALPGKEEKGVGELRVVHRNISRKAADEKQSAEKS